jgi:hypothetical protein
VIFKKAGFVVQTQRVVLFIFRLIHILAASMHMENMHIEGAQINYLFTYFLYKLRYFPIFCALFLVQFLQAIKFPNFVFQRNMWLHVASSCFFCKEIIIFSKCSVLFHTLHSLCFRVVGIRSFPLHSSH